MKLDSIYASTPFALSFEFFPPKTAKGEAAMYEHARRLLAFSPSYMTCTYGAGGSTQDKTLEIAARLRSELGLPVATHLTCVGRNADQLRDYLTRALAKGIENVVALRGDPPQGDASFRPVEGGFSYANELVAMIHAEFPSMGIAVGGYPEVHQEAPSAEADLENLKRKVDAGADSVITQLFYDNADFFRFRERCEAAGVGVPIIPGLLPVTNVAQIRRIASLCGARLPDDFAVRLEGAGDDAEEQFRIGIDQATRQSQELVDAQAPGIHYYVLNKSEAASRVLEALSISA